LSANRPRGDRGKYERETVDEIHKRHISDRTYFLGLEEDERDRQRPQAEDKDRGHDKYEFFVRAENTPFQFHCPFSAIRGIISFFLFDKEKSSDGEESEKESDKEQLMIAPAQKRQEKKSGQGPHGRAKRVHRPMEPIGPPKFFPWHGFGDQGISRRIAKSFTNPIEDAEREDLPVIPDYRKEEADRNRDAVPHDGWRFPLADLVRKPSGKKLEDARDRVGGSFDEAHEKRRRAKCNGEKHGDDRLDHLRRKIIEKTDESEKENVLPHAQYSGTHLRNRQMIFLETKNCV